MVSHLNPCFCTLKFTNSTNRLRLLLKEGKMNYAELILSLADHGKEVLLEQDVDESTLPFLENTDLIAMKLKFGDIAKIKRFIGRRVRGRSDDEDDDDEKRCRRDSRKKTRNAAELVENGIIEDRMLPKKLAYGVNPGPGTTLEGPIYGKSPFMGRGRLPRSLMRSSVRGGTLPERFGLVYLGLGAYRGEGCGRGWRSSGTVGDAPSEGKGTSSTAATSEGPHQQQQFNTTRRRFSFRSRGRGRGF
jgi:hypothetical protein